jgi:hypothetical protein
MAQKLHSTVQKYHHPCSLLYQTVRMHHTSTLSIRTVS